MIRLTNWFNKKPVYVNENRLALVEGVYTDEGEMTKTRICCPKPIYVSETPEEVVAKVNYQQSGLRIYDSDVGTSPEVLTHDTAD